MVSKRSDGYVRTVGDAVMKGVAAGEELQSKTRVGMRQVYEMRVIK